MAWFIFSVPNLWRRGVESTENRIRSFQYCLWYTQNNVWLCNENIVKRLTESVKFLEKVVSPQRKYMLSLYQIIFGQKIESCPSFKIFSVSLLEKLAVPVRRISCIRRESDEEINYFNVVLMVRLMWKWREKVVT